jgi:hypothetical protein
VGLERDPLSQKAENTAVRIVYTDHATPSIRKSWHQLHRQKGHFSVGVFRSPTKAKEFSFVFVYYYLF